MSVDLEPYADVRRRLVGERQGWQRLASFGALCQLVGESHMHDCERRWLIALLQTRAAGMPIVVPEPRKPLVLPPDFYLFAPPRSPDPVSYDGPHYSCREFSRSRRF